MQKDFLLMIDQEIEKNELNLLSDELDSLQEAKQVLIEEIESTKNDNRLKH